MRSSALHAPAAKLIGQLLLSWLMMGLILRFTPPFFGGDLDTARNYLSTLASTLATILALSVSVIMVAIQLTASKYTHRVLDFFVRFPYNASLLSFYLGTIVHAIYLLSRISDTPGDRPPTLIDQGMSADLLLLIACFFSLLIYLYHVIQLLKPETIVRGIQREYLVSFQHGEYQTALDQVEQICDIAKKAVSEMDAVTADLCVANIAEMMHAAKLPTDHANDGLWYHERIVGQLVGIASIACKEREVGVCARVLQELEEIGVRDAESGYLKAATTVLNAYALIVRNNLVGHQMMNMIQQAVESVYRITCHVVKSRPPCAETRHFVLQAFRNLGEIGKLVLKSETYGHSFVAKHVISQAFGQLLSTLIGHEGIERMGLVKALLFEYMKLAKRLVVKSEIHDIVQITTWLRNEMIPHREDPERVYPYLYLYMLLTSSSLYLRRTDVVMLLVRSVGKYFAPDEALLQTLCKSRIEIRHFYDYHEPERYLINMFVLWRSFHTYAQLYPLGPERHVKLGETVEDKELWRDLFDGIDPDEFLGQDAVL